MLVIVVDETVVVVSVTVDVSMVVVSSVVENTCVTVSVVVVGIVVDVVEVDVAVSVRTVVLVDVVVEVTVTLGGATRKHWVPMQISVEEVTIVVDVEWGWVWALVPLGAAMKVPIAVARTNIRMRLPMTERFRTLLPLIRL
ncbi:MAG TPA: hypothetical protein VFE91_01885 [Nitrososphaerales archaeon]|nr:hypothetical protein [Nitrososphaerales archaeon]